MVRKHNNSIKILLTAVTLLMAAGGIVLPNSAKAAGSCGGIQNLVTSPYSSTCITSGNVPGILFFQLGVKAPKGASHSSIKSVTYTRATSIYTSTQGISLPNNNTGSMVWSDKYNGYISSPGDKYGLTAYGNTVGLACGTKTLTEPQNTFTIAVTGTDGKTTQSIAQPCQLWSKAGFPPGPVVINANNPATDNLQPPGKQPTTGSIQGKWFTKRLDGAKTRISSLGIQSLSLTGPKNISYTIATGATESSVTYPSGITVSGGMITIPSLPVGTYNLSFVYDDSYSTPGALPPAGEEPIPVVTMGPYSLKVAPGPPTLVPGSDGNGGLGIEIDAPDTGADDGSSGPTCGTGSRVLTWIVCPVFDMVQKAADAMNAAITRIMEINTSSLFGTGKNCTPQSTDTDCISSSAYHKAWSAIRNIALIIIVLMGLVMIIAQAIGSQAVDAYTIKSVMPRLLIAAIFIALSWIIMEFLVSLTNVLGEGIRTIIYAPFSGLNSSINSAGTASVGGNILGGVEVFAMMTGAILLAVNSGVILALAVVLFIAVLVGFLVVALRQIMITFLIIIAPVAIALYILPNTKKAFNTWWDWLIRGLMMFPIITGFIAIGRVFSLVSFAQATGNGGTDVFYALLGIIAYIIPFFLLPFTFKMAGGAVGGIASAVQGMSKKPRAMLKKRAAQQAAKTWGDFRKGERFNKNNVLARTTNRLGAGLSTGVRGHFGIGAHGRQAIAGVERRNAAEATSNDKDLAELGKNSDDGIAVVALSGGTNAGARQAAEELRQSWIDTAVAGGTDQTTAEADATRRMNDALAQAMSLPGGLTKSRARAGMVHMMANKARALAGGEAGQELLAHGVQRLHPNNVQSQEEALHTAQYYARESGRADLGDNTVARGTQRAGASKVVRGHTAAVQAAMADVTARFAAARAAGDQEGAHRAAAEAVSYRNALGQDVSDDNKRAVYDGLEGMGIDLASGASTSQQFGAVLGLDAARSIGEHDLARTQALQAQATQSVQHRAGLWDQDARLGPEGPPGVGGGAPGNQPPPAPGGTPPAEDPGH